MTEFVARDNPGGDWYAFRHALIRDMAYKELVGTRLRPVHRMVARALERCADPPNYRSTISRIILGGPRCVPLHSLQRTCRRSGSRRVRLERRANILQARTGMRTSAVRALSALDEQTHRPAWRRLAIPGGQTRERQSGSRVIVRPILCRPFVGRRDELAYLRERRLEAGASRGSSIFIAGDAGLGKSRLIAELCRSLAYSRWRITHGPCREFGGRPYGPILDALAAIDRAVRR